ncbi:MAG: insulinase family protein [Deltaproteobacteria bacterium]|nr:insulinase family protein [Deltaproteobacteria bacterium]
MAAHILQQTVLKNGLTILGEANPAAQSAAVGYFVKTGARDETPREAGVSHFLEHMMFKGTKKRNALEITYELGNIGAQANAFTSEENTVYYAQVIPEYFGYMQELLSDMLRPALDEGEYSTEKKVILEEIALYKDRPHFYLFEHAMADFFSGHTAGNSVLGSTDSIQALARDEMKAYFDRRYAPSNMVLVGSGNFDWKTFVADAEKLTSAWQPFEAKREVRPHSPGSVKRVYRKKNITQSHVLFMTSGAGAQDEERYAMSVLSMMLGDSSGSKLYWELIDKGIAEDAGADNDERDGTGCFLAYGSTAPERLDEVAEIIQKVLSKPLDFSDEDLERAKTKLSSKIVLSGELPMGRLMAAGLEWNYRKKLHSLKDSIAKIRALSKKDIQQALEKFPLTSWSEFRLLPE